MTRRHTLPWKQWLQRWDAQQTRYIPHREERFDVMLDAAAALVGDEFTALDLCCGPGAISQRLLKRFPKARVVAADMNPILLELGRRNLHDAKGRMRWVECNLAKSDWVAHVREALATFDRPYFDAVLSTTALHWLPAQHLVRVYHDVAGLIRPGGVLLDGDHIAYPPTQPAFRALAKAHTEHVRKESFERQKGEDYKQWWAALIEDIRRDPKLNNLIEGYERTEAERERDFSEPILALHEAALLDAGFTEVGMIWQHLDDRVLLAVRGEDTEPIEN